MVDLTGDIAQSVTCNHMKKQIESIYPLGSNGNWEELTLATMIATFPASLVRTCLCFCILALLLWPQSQVLTELSCFTILQDLERWKFLF